MDTKHPAREFLLANLSFNLSQLKDLDFICELAQEFAGDTTYSDILKERGWLERIAHYRAILQQRISELEARSSQ